jgi:hypothetical protein
MVFLGIPLGRTLSRASIPVSSNSGKFWPVRLKRNLRQQKINDVLPFMGLEYSSQSPSYRHFEQSRCVFVG